MKKRLFFLLLVPFLSGCEIVASFYVEKAWITGEPWDASHPDMKTRASIDFKKQVGADAKKPIDKSK